MMDLHASRAIEWADNVHSSVVVSRPPSICLLLHGLDVSSDWAFA